MGEGCLYCTQEFIDRYGYFSAIPRSIKRGEAFTLTGKLVKDAHVRSVELRWEAFPKPMSVEEIDQTYSYSVPDDQVAVYSPDDTEYPISVKHAGGKELFSVKIASQKSWKPGLYYLLVLARGKTALAIISTRTFLLR